MRGDKCYTVRLLAGSALRIADAIQLVLHTVVDILLERVEIVRLQLLKERPIPPWAYAGRPRS